MSQRTGTRVSQLPAATAGHGFGAAGAIVGCVLLFAIVYAVFLVAVVLSWVNVGV